MARLSRRGVATAIALSACAATAASANLVLNGSFENNTAGVNQYNLSNAGFNFYMSNCSGFGTGNSPSTGGQIDIETNNVGSYGGDSGAGAWHVCVVAFDAFSMNLSQSLVAGQTYTISFLARNNTQFEGATGTGPLRIGTSSSNSSFGTEVFNSGALTSSWARFTGSFTAGSGANFLTVSGSQDASLNSWVMVDDISVTGAVPAPGALALLGIAGLAGSRRRR